MIDRMSPAAAKPSAGRDGVVLTRLVARGLDPLVGLPGASTAVTTVVRLRVEAQSLAHDGGGAMVPFPGMACP